jgi:hypothetical protein
MSISDCSGISDVSALGSVTNLDISYCIEISALNRVHKI